MTPWMNDAVLGLLIAVLAIVAAAVSKNAGDMLAWLRHGFDLDEDRRRLASAGFVFTGVLIYHVKAVAGRTVGLPDPAGYVAAVTANLSLGYGAALFHASRMERRPRVYFNLSVASMFVAAIGVPLARAL